MSVIELWAYGTVFFLSTAIVFILYSMIFNCKIRNQDREATQRLKITMKELEFLLHGTSKSI